MSVTQVLKPWAAVDAVLGLSRSIADEAQYTALLAFVDECFERFGGDDKHLVFGLVDLAAERLREYENRVHPWPDTSTPATVLASLMQDHGLRQTDLPELGSQGVVSEILACKRALNVRQIKAVAQRFGVAAELFIP